MFVVLLAWLITWATTFVGTWLVDVGLSGIQFGFGGTVAISAGVAVIMFAGWMICEMMRG